jgi:hypothetical protein
VCPKLHPDAYLFPKTRAAMKTLVEAWNILARDSLHYNAHNDRAMHNIAIAIYTLNQAIHTNPPNRAYDVVAVGALTGLYTDFEKHNRSPNSFSKSRHAG